MKRLLKKIRLRINRIWANNRKEKLMIKNPTIISNNCYAGIIYEYLGIPFYSPTIGLYFFAKDYIKFIKNLKHYINSKLIFIKPNESKYYDELVKKSHENSIVGKIDDVEIIFLHYKTAKEALDKWNRRCKRINWDCVLYKFCDQNLCTEEDIKEFDKLPLKNKFCFTSKEYKNYKSCIWIKKNVRKNDYYVSQKYFNIINFINCSKLLTNQDYKIKVLQCGLTCDNGGIENYILNYSNSLDKQKFCFDYVNIYNEKLCFEDEFKRQGSIIYKLPNYYRHPFKYMKQMKNILNRNNYNIVHCNMNSGVMIFPLIVAKMCNVKMIISHAHNSSSDKGLLKEILHNLIKNVIPVFANTYFSCSEKAGAWFYNKKIINSNKYFFIHNAIDVKKFSFSNIERKKMRKVLNINNDTFVIGHVGRFVPQKNHSFLIDIFNEVNKINSNSILLLIGQGPLVNEIKEKVEKYSLTEKVFFLGQRRDLDKLYQIFDVFVLPSIYEGLPLVGVEAQASGLPCVFSSSITEEVKINDNVEYVSLERNPEEWARTIIKKSEDNIDRKQLNNNVLKTNFNIINAVKELQKIYEKGILNDEINK